MSEDEFTKLFKYMSERFDAMDKRFDETANNADMEHVFDALDQVVRRLQAFH